MGKFSRDKGARFERELARIFRDALPGCDAKRGFQTRGGAAEMPDVTAGCFAIEAKAGKKPPVRAALKTAVDNCPKGLYPLAVIKEDRKPPFVVLPLDDFLEIAGEWWKWRTS